MAWAAVLYTFSKRVNSTKRPSSGSSYSCTANAPLDVLAPRLRFNLAGGAAANPSAYNYCQVSEFGRYYWIDRWIWEDGLWTAVCSVDPLASWRTQILGSTKYILRAAADSGGTAIVNNDYIDNRYPAQSKPDVVEYTKTSPWTGLTDASNGSFVVGIVGKGSTRYYKASVAEMETFLSIILDDAFYSRVLNVLGLDTLYPEAKIAINPLQYISAIRYYPFSITGDFPLAATPFGPVTLSSTSPDNVHLHPLPTLGNITGSLIWTQPMVPAQLHPDAGTRGWWLNNAPWSNYHLFFPPWGIIPLDPGIMCTTQSITAQWGVDVKTGGAALDIYGFTSAQGRVHLCRSMAQLGIDFPVANIQTPGYGLVSFMATALGAAGSVAGGSDPYLATAGGIAHAVGDAIAGQIPRLSMISSVGSTVALYGTPALQAVYYRPAPEDRVENGRPIMAYDTVSNYSGYIEVSDGEISAPAYPEELNSIASYMTGGVFIE